MRIPDAAANLPGEELFHLDEVAFSKVAMRFRWLSLAVVLLAVALMVAVPIVRVPYVFEIDYNEGWNVNHVNRAASGNALYADMNPWAPITYPPFSFLLIGSLSTVFGDPLPVGRVVSLLSLAVVVTGAAAATFWLVRDKFSAILACILCLGLFSAIAPHYVGMNDPQMLGNAIQVGALLIYLSNLEDRRRLTAVALLIAVSLFVKHSLVVLPAAIGLDLLVRSRSQAMLWLTALSLALLGFTLVTILSLGNAFLDQLQLSFGRGYQATRALRLTLKHITVLQLPLALGMGWSFYSLGSTRNRIIALYLLTSLAIGAVFAGGHGTDVNMFFDLFISMSIACAAGLHLLVYYAKQHLKSVTLIEGIAPLALSVGILAAGPNLIVKPGTKAHFMNIESAFSEDIKFVASFPGPVICERLLICVEAGKGIQYDPFAASELFANGKLSEAEFLQTLERREWDVVQINAELGARYLDALPYTSVFKPTPTGRYTENVLRALGSHYVLARSSQWGAFYIPKR